MRNFMKKKPEEAEYRGPYIDPSTKFDSRTGWWDEHNVWHSFLDPVYDPSHDPGS